MLKYFTIQNFKSFCKPQTFSMEADINRVSEKQETLLTVGSSKLLRTASFYGPNGSGKSNLIKGLCFLRYAVIGSVDYRFVTRPHTESKVFSPCYYSNSKTISEQVIFCDDVYEYTYTFDAAIDKINDDIFDGLGVRPEVNFIGEKIEFKPLNQSDDEYETLLERTQDGKIMTKFFSSLDHYQKVVLGQSVSVISYILEQNINLNAQSRLKEFDVILGLFNQIRSIHLLNERNLHLGMREIKSMLEKKEDKEFIALLNDFGLNIKAIKFSKSRLYDYQMNIVRSIQGKDITFNYDEESDGTQKIILLASRFYSARKSNIVFCCDDLDSQLHPKIIEALIKLFHDKRIGFKQFIFNSHDLINMNKENFRRDEIWLTYKDEESSTIIVPLSNLTNSENKQIRKDESYNKRYLEGRYGADPFIAKALHLS
jgi:AAA15 family ATPase/GTPase